MPLPITTHQLEVLPAGQLQLDAQRRPVRGAAGAARGPFGAVLSLVAADELPPEERTGDQLRLVRVHLQAGAWPLGAGDRLRDTATGELYDVTGAARRDQLPQLDHVVATARRVEA